MGVKKTNFFFFSCLKLYYFIAELGTDLKEKCIIPVNLCMYICVRACAYVCSCVYVCVRV